MRYTANTNVATIAFIPVFPQSHRAHATMRARPAVGAEGGGFGACWVTVAHDIDHGREVTAHAAVPI
ncbi:hypothetical protein MMON_09570 [Mycolicibacterium monacense]|uniref:Uncharacterized protein n=1 Tax=Mycolicibacterium monacense TaxID=85693 RepID=A0AAD1IW93_MYCMB|nr:hypothetical protein MMON_09570 [Mycolicibacterium monacense]